VESTNLSEPLRSDHARKICLAYAV
jgi:hypothetical protein